MSDKLTMFKVLNTYTDRKSPSRSGHWVIAKDDDDAFRIADENGIASTFNRKPIHRIVIFHADIPAPFGPFNIYKQYKKAKVWAEIDGVFIGFSTPLIESGFPIDKLNLKKED